MENQHNKNEIYEAFLKSINENYKHPAVMMEREAETLMGRFRELEHKNLTILTSALTENKSEDERMKQLSELTTSYNQLDLLALEYNLVCGKADLDVSYKNAYIAGELARKEIIKILGLGKER